MEQIQDLLETSQKQTRRLAWGAAISIAVFSAAGLLVPGLMYPGVNSAVNIQPNDLLNLAVGVPLLLVPVLLIRRGKQIGQLLLPGGVLYNFYNYLAYIIGLSFQVFTIGYILILALLLAVLYQILKTQDPDLIRDKLSHQVPARFTGWLVTLFGVLFIGRSAGMFWEAAVEGTQLPPTEIGVLAADILLSLILISGGILLIRRKPLGYVLGPGIMLAVSALFLGVTLLVLIQPLFTGTPLDVEALLTLLVMSLIFWIPAWLFLRGTLRGLGPNHQKIPQS